MKLSFTTIKPGSRKIILLTLLGLFSIIINDSLNNQAHTSSSGAPAGRTGSPGDGSNCTACHAGTATTSAGLITSNIPAGGYTPGQTYQITASVSSPGRTKFGFQVSPQNISGTLLGTLVNTTPTLTQLVGSSKYITHTSAGNQGGNGSHSWTFNWIAPTAGTGNVTFYGAFNATNSNNSTSGDIIFLSTLAVQECVVATPLVNNSTQTVYNICQGESVTLTSGNAPAYLWNTGATTQSITVDAQGTYSVSAINGAGCSATSVTITVNVLPAPPPPIVNVNGSTNLCQGETVTLSTGSSNCYQWLPGGQTTQSIQVSQTGSYTVTTCDNNGCSSVSAPIQINVSPNPAAPAINASGATTFCEGDSVVLSSSSASGYSWSSGQNAQSIVVNQTGSYTVTIQDNNGCTATSTVTTISVNANPATVITGPLSVCLGSGTTAYQVFGSGNNYNWSLNNGTLVSGQSTPAVEAEFPAIGIAQLSIQETNPVTGCSTSISVDITVNDSLSPVISSGGQSGICPDGFVTLDAGTGFTTYLWNTGETSQTITVSNPGQFQVSVSDASGCSGSSGTPLEVVQLTVDTALSLNGFTLTANAGSAIYQWIDCLSQLPVQGANQQSFTVSQNGTYALVITTSDGCTDTSSCYEVIVTDLAERLNQTFDFSIYPVPADQLINLRFIGLTENERAFIQISDSFGRVVHSDAISATESQQAPGISVAGLSAGLYFIRIDTPGHTKIKRFVVQH
jgi:large repetitive protein